MIKKLTLYGFLILYSLTTLFPFIWMLSSSFKSSGAIFAFPPELIPDLLFRPGMFDNYRTVLTEHSFLLYLWNSFFISSMASIGQILTCSMAAFALARLSFPGKGVIFALLIATMMIPDEVTIMPEFLIFSSLDWLDSYLPLIVPSFFVGAFGTFMLKEYFANYPREIEEASIVDGCNYFQTYWHIFMPTAKAALATLFIIAFMNNWNEILRPVLYINSPQLRTVSLGLTEFQTMYTTDWHLLLAATVLSVIPLILVYVFAQKYIIDGMIRSGIKG